MFLSGYGVVNRMNWLRVFDQEFSGMFCYADTTQMTVPHWLKLGQYLTELDVERETLFCISNSILLVMRKFFKVTVFYDGMTSNSQI